MQTVSGQAGRRAAALGGMALCGIGPVGAAASCDVAGIAGVRVSADAARCLDAALDGASTRLQALVAALPASCAVAAGSARR